MKIWRDTTLWSQDDVDRGDPREWTLDVAKDLKIIIHRRFRHSDSIWFLTCHKVGVSAHEMGSMSADEAKEKAYILICAHVDKLTAALKKLEE